MSTIIDTDPVVAQIMRLVRNAPGKTEQRVRALIRAGKIAEAHLDQFDAEVFEATFAPDRPSPE